VLLHRLKQRVGGRVVVAAGGVELERGLQHRPTSARAPRSASRDQGPKTSGPPCLAYLRGCGWLR
jgi:hypothetical protein